MDSDEKKEEIGRGESFVRTKQFVDPKEGLNHQGSESLNKRPAVFLAAVFLAGVFLAGVFLAGVFPAGFSVGRAVGDSPKEVTVSRPASWPASWIGHEVQVRGRFIEGPIEGGLQAVLQAELLFGFQA
jgi:hypothetical protein